MAEEKHTHHHHEHDYEHGHHHHHHEDGPLKPGEHPDWRTHVHARASIMKSVSTTT